jgi:23S rRNA (guanosine2251-2'-O)-methyltransferase
MEYIYGLHNILALLDTTPNKLNKIYINRDKKKQYQYLINNLALKNIKTIFCGTVDLEKMIKHSRHNGLVAEVSNIEYTPELDLKQTINNININDNAIFILLDGITDTNNLGAIIRSCECFGVKGVIIPSNNSAPVNHTVARVSAGALHYMPVFVVNNLLHAIDLLKEHEYLIAATVLNNKSQSLAQFTPSKKMAWILGNEETGIRPIIQKAADVLIKIDMFGHTQSLNVSVTTALVVFDTLNKILNIDFNTKK